MKRLPIWMLLGLVGISALLIWVGLKEQDQLGPLPLILGIIWTLFTLGSIPKAFADDD